MKDEIQATRETVGVVAELIKVAGANPQAREAAQNLGTAAVTISRTINTALLPLAAVNFAFDKARKYFESDFQQDLLDRTKEIPIEYIANPKASIAGPALQGLAFSSDEIALKEMFLRLVATAMDKRIAETAHPAFVEVIKQLEGAEAELLAAVLCSPEPLPIVQIRRQPINQQGWHVMDTHIMNLRNPSTDKSIEYPHFPAMVDNWTRLGLVEFRYDEHLLSETAYSWSDSRPELLRAKAQYQPEPTTISIKRGIIRRTAFGLKFAGAVGLLQGHMQPTNTSDCQ